MSRSRSYTGCNALKRTEPCYVCELLPASAKFVGHRSIELLHSVSELHIGILDAG